MFAFIPLLVIGAAVAVVSGRRSRARRAWAEVAAHHDLELRPGGMLAHPSLRGWVGETLVQVEMGRIPGGGDSSYTRYVVAHEPAGPPVKMTRQHTFSFVTRIFGTRDVTIGDPHFDESIVVDTHDTHAITAFLTPTRRAAILDLFQTWPHAEVTHDSIMVATRGLETDARVMAGTIRRLVDTGEVLADAAAFDHALEQRDAGNLAAGAAELRRARDERGPNTFTQILEAKTRIALAEPDDAIRILDEAADILPADPEVAAWIGAAGSATTAASGPEPEGGLAQQAVIDDLLGPSLPAHETEQRFRSTYGGRPITWTGEVTSAQRFRRDLDFSTDDGIKATLDIGSIGRSALMSNRVRAVAAFSPETELARGDTVTFRGTLLRVDRYSRAIYVAAAEVTPHTAP